MSASQGFKPSRLAQYLLHRFIDTSLHEELQGDLAELYQQRSAQQGRAWAYCMYWVETLHLVRNFASHKSYHKPLHSTMSIRLMTRVALRYALRQKQFTLLNILGLTVGIAISLLAGLYIYEQNTYDTYHSHGDRVYRVNQPLIWENWDVHFASTGPGVGQALREEIPELEQVSRLLSMGPKTVRLEREGQQANLYLEDHCYYAEENLHKLFTFATLAGNLSHALATPHTVIMTRSTAMRYFGQITAIGQSLEIKNQAGTWERFSVGAVIEDQPHKSHLQFDMLLSLSSRADAMRRGGWKWIWTAFSTYVLVQEGADIAAIEAKMQALPPKYAGATTERIFNQSFEDYTAGKTWWLSLQPLREIYLAGAPAMHRFGPTGSPDTMEIIGLTGLFILLLSCINFINLSTSRSVIRAKEVRVRKVLGSARQALVVQFLYESLLYVVLATVLGLLLLRLLLPFFNELLYMELSMENLMQAPWFLLSLLAFVLVLSLVAGSYPAFYLSSFKPLGSTSKQRLAPCSARWVRNSLVVCQFTISTILIICTLFVQKQLSFMAQMELGLNDEQIIQLPYMEQMPDKVLTLKERLLRLPEVEQVGVSHSVPPYVWEGERYKTQEQPETVMEITNLRTEADYVSLLGLELIEGRNFDPTRQTDRYGVILNETAVRLLGWGTPDTYAANNPVGKYVIQAFDDERELPVLGVVKDFNFNDLTEAIGPLMILHQDNDWYWNYRKGRQFLSLQVKEGALQQMNDYSDLIGQIKKEVHALDASVPFHFTFMDQEFDKAFRAERRLSRLLHIFTLLAVFIACLGLFGLAAYTAERRTKELSIRKVLGARVLDLVYLFSTEFTRLVFLAVLLGAPLAYYLVSNWLLGFPYQTPVELWVFVLVGLAALLIGFLTISYQSVAVAHKNPVETLKDE